MPIKNPQSKKNLKLSCRKGFSLIETLLAVLIIVGLIFVMMSITKNATERLLHEAMAQYVNQVRMAVRTLLDNPTNYNIIYTAADGTTDGFIETDIDSLRNGTVLPGNVLPPVDNFENSFVDNTFFQNGLDIIIRIADARGNMSDTRELEIFVVSNDLVPFLRARGIASELVGYGGIIDNLDFIESVYASWVVPLANLENTSWHTNATASTATDPSIQNGIYVVSYDHIDFEDVTGDYLYRSVEPGSPELNRMFTNLDLGNNNILGVDDLGGINADGENYGSGSITINSKLVLNGAALQVNNANINGGNVYVDGTVDVDDELIIGNTGTSGRFQTAGTIQIGETIRRNGTVQTDSSLNVGQLNVVSGEFNRGATFMGKYNGDNLDIEGSSEFQSINANIINLNIDNPGNPTVPDPENNVDIIVERSIFTRDLASDDVNVTGEGVTEALNSEFSGSANINHLISTESLNINTLEVEEFGDCDIGC